MRSFVSQKLDVQNLKGLKKAESLVEVIIAIFVVALGSGVATSLIVSALQANAFSRDNLTALNLAVEGIEAMRAIRDENWLKFSSDKENCWNLRPEENVGQDCTVITAKIASGHYTADLELDPNNYGWGLPTGISSALDLENNGADNEKYQLDYYDIDTAVNSDNLGTASDDHDIFATKGLSALPLNAADSGSSQFYRMIQVDYPSTCATAPKCDEMDVISLVQWRSQGTVHQILLTSQLTDYQKIKIAT